MSPAPPPPLDFLDLDRLLTDEERLIRDTVRRFVADRILPDVADWFERGELPAGSWPGSSATSACSACTWRATAAPAPTRVSYGLACLELEAGDSGHPQLRLRPGLAGHVRDPRFGSEEQKRAVAAAGMAAGEVIGCFGLTEPDHGSDPAGMRTSAAPRRRRLGAQRHQDVDHQRRSPTSPSSGRGPTTGRSAASSSRPTPPASPPATIAHKLSPARLGHLRARPRRTCGCPPTPCCPASAACAARCAASTRPATGSSGARSARPGTATRPPSTTRGPASSSAGRSPASS